MLVEESFVARLTRTEAATGPLVDNRIMPDYLPVDTLLPAVVYERKPGSEPDYLINGALDCTKATWKFHCYAAQDNKRDALDTAAAIVKDLNRYHDASDPTLTVHYMFVTDQYDAYDSDTKRHRTTVEIEILYSETALATMS